MKMLAEYLDTAINFEQMAAQENDPKLKASLKGKPPVIASSRKRNWTVVASVIGISLSTAAPSDSSQDDELRDVGPRVGMARTSRAFSCSSEK